MNKIKQILAHQSNNIKASIHSNYNFKKHEGKITFYLKY